MVLRERGAEEKKKKGEGKFFSELARICETTAKFLHKLIPGPRGYAGSFLRVASAQGNANSAFFFINRDQPRIFYIDECSDNSDNKTV